MHTSSRHFSLNREGAPLKYRGVTRSAVISLRLSAVGAVMSGRYVMRWSWSKRTLMRGLPYDSSSFTM